MQVILLERVENLGQMGDEVVVKDGYARNYLLPRKKALRATKQARERFEQERVQLEARNLERKKEAEAVGTKLEGQAVVLLRQASEGGQLYGSVSSRDVAEAFTAKGFSLEKRQVVIEQAIKTLGLHKLKVALHPEVSVTVRVNVARSPEEAELQAQGIDVMAQMFEKDVAGFTEERDENAEPGEIPPAEPAEAAGEGEAASEAEAPTEG